jgi:hypothetical protein
MRLVRQLDNWSPLPSLLPGFEWDPATLSKPLTAQAEIRDRENKHILPSYSSLLSITSSLLKHVAQIPGQRRRMKPECLFPSPKG